MNRLWWSAPALLGATVLLSSCDEIISAHFNHAKFKEDFRYEYKLKPGGRLSVENLNGSVDVLAWEKEAVEVTGTKFADSQEHLDLIKIDGSSTPDQLRLKTVVPDFSHGGYGARYTIRVPARTVVDGVMSSNGTVRLEGLQGAARVKTSNGSIRVNRLSGDLDAHTTNGKVEVAGLKGAASIHTSNGSVQLDEVHGAIDASTSNGSITAHLIDPEAQKTIRMESSNGSVNLTLDQLRDNPIRVKTSNSSITLHLPPNANAQLSASTSHSSVMSEFDMAENAASKNNGRMEGKLGSGGPTVSLTTSNGGIRILKN